MSFLITYFHKNMGKNVFLILFRLVNFYLAFACVVGRFWWNSTRGDPTANGRYAKDEDYNQGSRETNKTPWRATQRLCCTASPVVTTEFAIAKSLLSHFSVSISVFDPVRPSAWHLTTFCCIMTPKQPPPLQLLSWISKHTYKYTCHIYYHSFWLDSRCI